MAHCRLCREELLPLPGSPAPASAPSFDICADCARKTGVVPMPPARRPMKPCLRCNGARFIRAIPREYTADGGDYSTELAAPMTVTAPPGQRERFFGGYDIATPNIVAEGRGLIEMYICTQCGYVEWYCYDPQSVPIGPEYMTELVDFTPGTPYR